MTTTVKQLSGTVNNIFFRIIFHTRQISLMDTQICEFVHNAVLKKISCKVRQPVCFYLISETENGCSTAAFSEPVGGALALRAPVTRRTAQELQSTRPGAPVAPRSNNPGRREASSKQRQRKERT